MQIRIMYSMFYNWRIIFKAASLTKKKKLVFFQGVTFATLIICCQSMRPNTQIQAALPTPLLARARRCAFWKENHSASSNNMHNEWRGNMLRVIKTMRIHFRRAEINKSDTWPRLKCEEGSSTRLSGLGFLEGGRKWEWKQMVGKFNCCVRMQRWLLRF